MQKITDKYSDVWDIVMQTINSFIKINRSLKRLNDSQINLNTEISADIQVALKIRTNPDIDKYLRRNKIDLSYIDID